MDKMNAEKAIANALKSYADAVTDAQKESALEDMKAVRFMVRGWNIPGTENLEKAIDECAGYLAGKKYVCYEVYQCPESPTESGRYVGKTPVYEQALAACENAEKCGKSYFIKAVDKEGNRYMVL